MTSLARKCAPETLREVDREGEVAPGAEGTVGGEEMTGESARNGPDYHGFVVDYLEIGDATAAFRADEGFTTPEGLSTRGKLVLDVGMTADRASFESRE